MLASAIREFAVSKNPQRIAAAYVEKTVQIWDPNTRTKVSEFPTVFDMGARNLALAPAADLLLAGRSRTGKIAAYEVTSGNKLWERKLGPYPSQLRFHSDGASIFCTRNFRSVIRIDAFTGTTLEEMDGIERYFEGPYGNALSVPSQEDRPLRLVSQSQQFEINRLSFALLDAQFSPQFVCFTEARGSVRCINYATGEQQWMFDPGNESHVVRLHYSRRMEALRHSMELQQRRFQASVEIRRENRSS